MLLLHISEEQVLVVVLSILLEEVKVLESQVFEYALLTHIVLEEVENVVVVRPAFHQVKVDSGYIVLELTHIVDVCWKMCVVFSVTHCERSLSEAEGQVSS